MVLASASLVFSIGLVAFMPEQWEARTSTINTYDQGCLGHGPNQCNGAAYNVATTHLTGAGFDAYTPRDIRQVRPNPLDLHAAQ